MTMHGVQKVTLASAVLLAAFWATLWFGGITEGTYNYLYSFLFGLVPLFGGAIAMYRSRIWGGLSSAIGKAVFFIGLGIFLWGCGETVWSYYNFFAGVAAPYPSLADIGFAPSIFFYGLGAFYLSKVTGARFGLRNPVARFFTFVAPVVAALISYHVLIVVARGGVLVPAGETVLKTILDIAYPLGDFVALLVAIVVSGLSFQYLGGRYRYDVIAIMAGLGAMYVGDTLFSYTTTLGTYYNANLGDLFLMTGLSLLTFGVLGFSKLKES